MASKRDLLKRQAQKNEQGRGADSVLTETATVNSSLEDKVIQEDEVKTTIEAPLPVSTPDKTDIKEDPEKAEIEKTEKLVEAKPTKKKKKYQGADKNFGMRLCCEEDIDFLNFYPIQLGMTKKTYFNSLMEKAIADADAKVIKFDDPLIKEFMKGGSASLTTRNVTIAVPEDMIEDIKKAGAKYRMLSQRFVAYVIHKARLTAKDYV